MDDETKAAAAVDGIRALKMDLNVKVGPQCRRAYPRCWHSDAARCDTMRHACAAQVEEVAALMYELATLKHEHQVVRCPPALGRTHTQWARSWCALQPPRPPARRALL